MGKRRKKHHNPNYRPQVMAQSVASSESPQAVVKPSEVKESSVYQAHQAEYKAISSDLIRVAVINGFFLAAVLALYFMDRSNPFLKDLFARIL